jgi:hypothetical protein
VVVAAAAAAVKQLVKRVVRDREDEDDATWRPELGDDRR